MRHSDHIAGLLLLTLTVSCVTENYSDCTPCAARTHIVSVTDKNYFNGAQFGDPIEVVDETLSFSSYVGSLVLWRHNSSLSDYQIYEASLDLVGQVYDLSVESYPEGVHRVTAIGNETLSSQTPGQSLATISLHPEGREYNDIYIGADDIPIPSATLVNVKMHRAKGVLVVFVDNIPDSVDSLYITTDNLYATIDREMNYSGSTSVTKGFKVAAADMIATVKLAPTVEAADSKVSLTLVDGSGERKSHDITSITIHRNEVSGVRDRIDPTLEDGHEVHVYTNGAWDRVTPLEIISQ